MTVDVNEAYTACFIKHHHCMPIICHVALQLLHIKLLLLTLVVDVVGICVAFDMSRWLSVYGIY